MPALIRFVFFKAKIEYVKSAKQKGAQKCTHGIRSPQKAKQAYFTSIHTHYITQKDIFSKLTGHFLPFFFSFNKEPILILRWMDWGFNYSKLKNMTI